MKITEIDTYVINQNLSQKDAFTYSQNRYNTRTILICRVATDDGIEGWGEAFGPAKIHQATIQEIYKPLVIGNDPFDTEVIWQKLYNTLRDHGQKGLSVEAISAIDIALWDIKAKAAARPLYKLLGGAFRERVIPYATGLYRSESEGEREKLINEVENYLNAGFKAIKVKIGFGLEYDVDIVKTIRDTFGYSYKMMVDPNHAYNASTAIALFGQCMPTFWLGIMLILIVSVGLRLLPPSGGGGFKYLVLPAITLGTYSAAVISRLLRSSLLEVLSKDYIRTARAKGLAENTVVYRHALKNAAIPVVTVTGMQIASLLGGAIITETVFSYPGVGLLAIQAIRYRDIPVVQAFVTIVAVIVVITNLIVDLAYSYLDPRVRLG